jgi:hypothetical protein
MNNVCELALGPINPLQPYSTLFLLRVLCVLCGENPSAHTRTDQPRRAMTHNTIHQQAIVASAKLNEASFGSAI